MEVLLSAIKQALLVLLQLIRSLNTTFLMGFRFQFSEDQSGIDFKIVRFFEPCGLISMKTLALITTLSIDPQDKVIATMDWHGTCLISDLRTDLRLNDIKLDGESIRHSRTALTLH